MEDPSEKPTEELESSLEENDSTQDHSSSEGDDSSNEEAGSKEETQKEQPGVVLFDLTHLTRRSSPPKEGGEEKEESGKGMTLGDLLTGFMIGTMEDKTEDKEEEEDEDMEAKRERFTHLTQALREAKEEENEKTEKFINMMRTLRERDEKLKDRQSSTDESSINVEGDPSDLFEGLSDKFSSSEAEFTPADAVKLIIEGIKLVKELFGGSSTKSASPTPSSSIPPQARLCSSCRRQPNFVIEHRVKFE